MDGFTITILKQKLKVRFLHPNEKAVICFVNDGVEEFKGVAKCNFDAGDKYDIGTGEGTALGSALEKRNKYYEKMIMEIEQSLSKKVETQETAIIKHWNNKIQKGKVVMANEYKNAQNETPPVEAYEN